MQLEIKEARDKHESVYVAARVDIWHVDALESQKQEELK